MKVVVYSKPHPTTRPNIWVIGWSHAWREKCKGYIFATGSEAEAQAKINTQPGPKYASDIKGVLKV